MTGKGRFTPWRLLVDHWQSIGIKRWSKRCTKCGKCGQLGHKASRCLQSLPILKTKTVSDLNSLETNVVTSAVLPETDKEECVDALISEQALSHETNLIQDSCQISCHSPYVEVVSTSDIPEVILAEALLPSVEAPKCISKSAAPRFSEMIHLIKTNIQLCWIE
ncbi:unnamed protein product [Arabis nemorensis]|uniref:CCHC-type domain-containing protein n=1 Tax=Arabis nemorensis TaxID=586526 RepID=A0A565BZA4_9BRAS|nr:unnamed protein product [Arabis nemorensis]